MMTRKMTFAAMWLAVLMMFSIFPVSVSAADTGVSGRMVTVQLPVSCVGKNTSETFEYLLSFENAEAQTVEKDTLRLKNGEEGSFTVTYTEPGTYHYTLSQKKGSDAGTAYDSTVYTIDVYVTENEDGTLFAEAVAYVQGNSGKKEKLDFVNEKELSEAVPEDETKGSNDKTGEDAGTDDAQNHILQTGNIHTGDTAQTGWLIGLPGSMAAMVLLAMIKRRREAAQR